MIHAKESIMLEALSLCRTHPVNIQTLELAAENLGHQPLYVHTIFVDGVDEWLLECYHYFEKKFLEQIVPETLDPLKIREKIHTLVKTYLELLSPYKSSLVPLAAYTSAPCHLHLAQHYLWNTSNHMWNLAGDTSTDINYYSKRTLLSAVLATTFLYWLKDDSPNHEQSWRFLTDRIDNVLVIGKFKRTLFSFFNKAA